MNIELQSMAIEMPRCVAHPNRAPFRGVLTLVDTPSDRSPTGANGHRVLLTRAACERALPSLLGMGLDYAPALDAHDAQRKIGIITEANIVGSRLSAVGSRVGSPEAAHIEVSGFLYARDFPRIVRVLRAASLAPAGGSRGHTGHTYGMSYEVTEARVEDMRAPVWIVTDFTFTGAAVLRRDKAAYRDTWFELIG
ncbi:MAG: hypothetical protein ACRD3E_20885 [Terriglobales bacterium]